MLFKPTEEEAAVQKLLIGQGRTAMLNVKHAALFEGLLRLRHQLVSREQDAWLLAFALANDIPVSKIKDFQFTREGEVLVGDDHEPTASGVDGEVGGRGATILDEERAQDAQAGDQGSQAQDGGGEARC